MLTYRSKLPFDAKYEPDFTIGDLEFYEVDVKKNLNWEYPNFYSKMDFAEDKYPRGIDQLFATRFFRNKLRAEGSGFHKAQDTKKIFNSLDDGKFRQLSLGYDPNRFDTINIDFENQQFAHMFVPLTKIETVERIPVRGSYLIDWFPINHQKSINYCLVGKFDFLTWSFEDTVWLCKELYQEFREPCLQSISKQQQMLNWMLS